MKKYRVSLCFTNYVDYIVEAGDEQAAIEKGHELYQAGDEGSQSMEPQPWSEGDMAEEIVEPLKTKTVRFVIELEHSENLARQDVEEYVSSTVANNIPYDFDDASEYLKVLSIKEA